MFGSYHESIQILLGIKMELMRKWEHIRAAAVEECLEALTSALEAEEKAFSAAYASVAAQDHGVTPCFMCKQAPATCYVNLYKDQEHEVCMACADKYEREQQHTERGGDYEG